MDLVTPIDEEYIDDDRVMLSQTDTEGKITYVNKKFCATTAYSSNELIGSTYEIIRHPDMPSVVFEKMWETISIGQTWTGLVKNLRKDGKYYWDDLSVLPLKNDFDKIIGYISCARVASKKNIKENEELYSKMLKNQLLEGNL